MLSFFAASSVKKMSRFEEVSPEKIKRIALKFTKTVILLGLAGYELIITNSAYIGGRPVLSLPPNTINEEDAPVTSRVIRVSSMRLHLK